MTTMDYMDRGYSVEESVVDIVMRSIATPTCLFEGIGRIVIGIKGKNLRKTTRVQMIVTGSSLVYIAGREYVDAFSDTVDDVKEWFKNRRKEKENEKEKLVVTT